MKYSWLILAATLLVRCEKGELPVPPHAQGEAQIGVADMGADYGYQVWFSLSDNRVVHKNKKTDWDLSFEASSQGYRVCLNGSKAMRVYPTTASALEAVADTAGIASGGRADRPSGHPDSTAIGDWRQQSPVYIINRGYTEWGRPAGFLKLKLLSVTPEAYVFEYADFETAQVHRGRVTKNTRVNWVAYSFDTHAAVAALEPPRETYDLCFTNYTHLFYDPLQYYQVTGVLINSYGTRVARITDKPFQQLVLGDTLGRRFESRRNSIGYDWKTFDLKTNLYSVNSAVTYLIQDSRGYFFKLRFVDFYSPQGLKGVPKFEFQRL